MIPELIVIDTVDGLYDLHAYLQDKDIIAYDCETTGLTDKHQVVGFSVCAEESKAYYVCLTYWDLETKTLKSPYDLDMSFLIQHILGLLKTKHLVMHNGIFDCMMADAFFKISLIGSLHTDTMVLAHTLDENRRVGLKELAASLYGDSSTQEAKEMQQSVIANQGVWLAHDKEMFKADYKILGKYGAKDAWLTYKLFFDLATELGNQGLIDFFYTESMPLLRGPTYELNTTGMLVDTNELTALKATLVSECAEAKAFIYSEINEYIKDKYPGTNKKNSFNIGASQQLAWLLFGKYELEFGTLTKGGKSICKALGLRLPYTAVAKRQFIHTCLSQVGLVYQPEAIVNGKKVRAKKLAEPWKYIGVDKKTLAKLAHKLKWVDRLLEYQRKNKLLNTYVEGIEERIQYGVIKPSYLQHGTKTGRYASRNPNLQNLPRNDQRVKNCFIARPGKVFVSADYSQLEPRTFASYSKDPKLMAAFDGSSDFYSVVGREVYDKYDSTPQKDGSPEAFGVKYKKLRDMSKTIALAAAYGATPNQLAPVTGKSIEDTTDDMEKYFERFPGVQTMMLEAHNLAKKQGYVTSLFGRVRRIPEAKRIVKLYGNAKHWDLPYDARKLLNMACNFRIQSTGASIVNRAAIAFHNKSHVLGIKCKLIQQVHDELVVECNTEDSDRVATILRECMETTTLLPGVPLEAIPRISKTLAK